MSAAFTQCVLQLQYSEYSMVHLEHLGEELFNWVKCFAKGYGSSMAYLRGMCVSTVRLCCLHLHQQQQHTLNSEPDPASLQQHRLNPNRSDSKWQIVHYTVMCCYILCCINSILHRKMFCLTGSRPLFSSWDERGMQSFTVRAVVDFFHFVV